MLFSYLLLLLAGLAPAISTRVDTSTRLQIRGHSLGKSDSQHDQGSSRSPEPGRSPSRNQRPGSSGRVSSNSPVGPPSSSTSNTRASSDVNSPPRRSPQEPSPSGRRASTNEAPNLGGLFLQPSSQGRQRSPESNLQRQRSGATDALSARINPVTIRASVAGKAMMQVHKGDLPFPSQKLYIGSGKSYSREFSHPHKLSVNILSLEGGTHHADATGRKVEGSVNPGTHSQGQVSSWSYANGVKTKMADPGGPVASTKASSSRIDAPVGATGDLHGVGRLEVQASNSPRSSSSTSPPGSPGRQLPQLEYLLGPGRRGKS